MVDQIRNILLLFGFYEIIETNSLTMGYPPASKASREVANLTERKNPHTPVYDVKEFVCVCPSVINFDPTYLGLAKRNGKKILGLLFVCKGAGRAGAEGQKSNILTRYTLYITEL